MTACQKHHTILTKKGQEGKQKAVMTDAGVGLLQI